MNMHLDRLKYSKQYLLDRAFINCAKEIGALSHCVSHQVGAVFVKDGRILITGVNGTPSGYPNCDDVFNHPGENDPNKRPWDREAHHAWSSKYEIHGEMNGTLFAGKYGIKLDSATCYSSLQPCPDCVKNLVQVGISRVVFGSLYDKGSSFKDVSTFYKKFKIPFVHFEEK